MAKCFAKYHRRERLHGHGAARNRRSRACSLVPGGLRGAASQLVPCPEAGRAHGLGLSGMCGLGEAVLAMRDLALVNLPRIRVAARRRTRAKLPATIELVRVDVPDDEVTSCEGIPAVTAGPRSPTGGLRAELAGAIVTESAPPNVRSLETRSTTLRACVAHLWAAPSVPWRTIWSAR